LRVILNAKAQRATIPPLRAVFAPLHSGKFIDISFEHFTMEETLSVGIGGDDQRTSMALDEPRKSGLDCCFGVGVQDIEVDPLRADGFLHLADQALGI